MTSPSDPNVHRPVPPDFAPGVRDAVYAHVYRDPHTELGGVLVGDRRATGVMIVGAIRAEGARGDLTSLNFTQEAWAGMLQELATTYPGAEILGWYHSHPGHGIFLSEQDLFIHRNFFAQPWQTALVVDPQRHEEGIFMWEGGEVTLAGQAPVDPRWALVASGLAAPPPVTAPPPNEPPADDEEPLVTVTSIREPVHAEPAAPAVDASAAQDPRDASLDEDERRALEREKRAEAREHARARRGARPTAKRRLEPQLAVAVASGAVTGAVLALLV